MCTIFVDYLLQMQEWLFLMPIALHQVIHYILPLHKQTIVNALNDLGLLGLIYQGLAKHITTKYGGSQYLPELRHQTCS